MSNIVRLLQLPADVQRGLIEGKISEGHGRALLQVADRDRQLALYELIVKRGMNTEQATDLAKEWTARPHLRHGLNKSRGEEIKAIESHLRIKLGVRRVSIDFAQNGGGRITLTFLSNEEFKDLVERINQIE